MFTLFDQWFAKAQAEEGFFSKAMCLATCTKDGYPSNRMVLMQHYDSRGWCFYTNFESRKGKELQENPRAAATFFWEKCKRSVRIEGDVEEVTAKEADDYFNSRPYGSRVGAWASQQSQPLATREELVAEVAKFEEKYPEQKEATPIAPEDTKEGGTSFKSGSRVAGTEVPRPPHWSGFRIMPRKIEFWEEGEFRLHHRHQYTMVKKEGDALPEWELRTLQP